MAQKQTKRPAGVRGRSFGDLPHIRIFICAQSLQILLIGVIKDPVVRKADYGERFLLKRAIAQQRLISILPAETFRV